jgi:hypothetical protein
LSCHLSIPYRLIKSLPTYQFPTHFPFSMITLFICCITYPRVLHGYMNHTYDEPPLTQTPHTIPLPKPFAHISPSHKPFTETLDQTPHPSPSHKSLTQVPHTNPSHKPLTQVPHTSPSHNTLTPSLPIPHSFLVFDNMSIASHIGRRIGVSRVFHGCFTGVSRVFHGCFTGVHGCFTGVHGYLFGHKNHSPRP